MGATTAGSGANLAKLMDLTPEDYDAQTCRINANHDGIIDLKSHHATQRLKGFLAAVAPASLIIFVGRSAGRHLKLTRKADFGQIIEDHGRRIVVIPHTSGRNRYWNDRGNKARIALILRQQLDWVEAQKTG
jgi:hypothetical protein